MFQNKFIIDTVKCSLCQICVLTCPRAALEFEEDKNGIEIIMNRSLCEYACQVCQDKCPGQAIQLEKNSLLYGKDRWFISYGVCRECGQFVEPSTENNICPRCRRKLVALRQAAIYPYTSNFRK